MQRFRSMKALQQFSSIHAQVHNHFNQERHLVNRDVSVNREARSKTTWRKINDLGETLSQQIRSKIAYSWPV